MNFYKLLLVFILVTIAQDTFSQNITSKEVLLEIDKKTNCKIRYYYYPNMQAYFDLVNKVYYYQENGVWQTVPTLPKNYGGYSLYKMNYVPITDYEGEAPYQYLKIHKKQFPVNYKGAKK